MKSATPRLVLTIFKTRVPTERADRLAWIPMGA